MDSNSSPLIDLTNRVPTFMVLVSLFADPDFRFLTNFTVCPLDSFSFSFSNRSFPAFRLLCFVGFIGLAGFALLPTISNGQTDVPAVEFSKAHAATCKVNVGDKFPMTPLPDNSKNLIKMEDIQGKKLTVVLIWNDRQAYAKYAYQRFSKEFVMPFAASGVKGIAINRGDSLDAVQRSADEFGKGIATLRDTDDKLWKQIATEKMPRFYLLDKDGVILWMDLEFSEGTSRDLRRAIMASIE